MTNTSSDVPLDDYLEHGLSMRDDEVPQLRALLRRLPSTIIDCHVHTNLEAHVGRLSPRTLGHMMSTFPSFSLEQSHTAQAAMYAGKSVRSLRFPHVLREVDHREANAYLLAESPTTDCIAVYGIVDDIDYTHEVLAAPRASGLKMYYHDVDPPATAIFDYFRPEILAIAESLHKPIILHLPTPITKSYQDLETVLESFPNLKVVLAHMGLMHLADPGLEDIFGRFSSLPNVYVDTARVMSQEVLECGMSVFGSERVLCGSDEPLNLIRTIPFIHPTKGERVASDYEYHWTDPQDHQMYSHLASNIPLAHIAEIDSIVSAADCVFDAPEAALEAIFYLNSARLFGFS